MKLRRRSPLTIPSLRRTPVENIPRLSPRQLASFFEAIPRCFDDIHDGHFWLAYFTLQYHCACRVGEVALVMDRRTDQRTVLIPRLRRSLMARANGGVWHVRMPITTPVAAAIELARETKRHRGFGSSVFLFPSKMRPRPALARGALLRRSDDGDEQAVSRFTAMRVMRKVMDAASIGDDVGTDCLKHTQAIMRVAMSPPRSGQTIERLAVFLDSTPSIVSRYTPLAADFLDELDADTRTRLSAMRLLQFSW